MKVIISYSDFIICNKDDAYSCASYLGADIGINPLEKDRLTIALALTTYFKVNSSRQRTVIITDSSNPIAVANNGETFEVPAIDLESSKLLDSNGAGDSFAGGFFAALSLIGLKDTYTKE